MLLTEWINGLISYRKRERKNYFDKVTAVPQQNDSVARLSSDGKSITLPNGQTASSFVSGSPLTYGGVLKVGESYYAQNEPSKPMFIDGYGAYWMAYVDVTQETMINGQDVYLKAHNSGTAHLIKNGTDLLVTAPSEPPVLTPSFNVFVMTDVRFDASGKHILVTKRRLYDGISGTTQTGAGTVSFPLYASHMIVDFVILKNWYIDSSGYVTSSSPEVGNFQLDTSALASEWTKLAWEPLPPPTGTVRCYPTPNDHYGQLETWTGLIQGFSEFCFYISLSFGNVLFDLQYDAPSDKFSIFMCTSGSGFSVYSYTYLTPQYPIAPTSSADIVGYAGSPEVSEPMIQPSAFLLSTYSNGVLTTDVLLADSIGTFLNFSENQLLAPYITENTGYSDGLMVRDLSGTTVLAEYGYSEPAQILPNGAAVFPTHAVEALWSKAGVSEVSGSRIDTTSYGSYVVGGTPYDICTDTEAVISKDLPRKSYSGQCVGAVSNGHPVALEYTTDAFSPGVPDKITYTTLKSGAWSGQTISVKPPGNRNLRGQYALTNAPDAVTLR